MLGRQAEAGFPAVPRAAARAVPVASVTEYLAAVGALPLRTSNPESKRRHHLTFLTILGYVKHTHKQKT